MLKASKYKIAPCVSRFREVKIVQDRWRGLLHHEFYTRITHNANITKIKMYPEVLKSPSQPSSDGDKKIIIAIFFGLVNFNINILNHKTVSKTM